MKTQLILALFLAAGSGAGQLAVADDFDWPARKPGQWSLEMKASKDTPAMTVQLCLDAATDKGMMQTGMGIGKSLCPNQKIAREGDKIVIESKCDLGGMKVDGRTEITGDFQSNYTMTTKADVTDAPEGMDAKTDVEHKATWVSGTCGDGMVPGDMLMPGGIKMNMKQMMGMMESLGKATQP